MPSIIECVPNFSEGRDPVIIQSITSAIEAVDGVKLLNVDPGKATNRTVVTFVGEPAAVVEAALAAIRRAGELIDMRSHKGEHPRMGATDVCPLIPVSGITMEETAAWAKKLAERVGTELQIPVYLYESAQPDKSRSNLSVIRAGEYEGFEEKISRPEWKPDFGPAFFDAKRGATVIGARDFLVAYNVNLNTTSVRRANSIAFDVREAGRVKREGDPVTGKIVKDAEGKAVNLPGSLKSVKAIGWYIEEYGIAQISMNLTDISVTPLHVAFDEVCRKAGDRGIRVTGSELVGLIPLGSILDAGKYFLRKQQRSAGVSETELIRIAVLSMGLDELAPFRPEEKIIEYLLADPSHKKLARLSLEDFSALTASEQTAPGGGSVSAYLGALAAALGGMVANLSAHKKGWDGRWEFFSQWAEQAESIRKALMSMVDADTRAFQAVMAAMQLPKSSPAEKEARKKAITAATHQALEVPFGVMQLGLNSLEIIKKMAEEGNPNSATDAGVGALCARASVAGAHLNVRVNARGYETDPLIAERLKTGVILEKAAVKMEADILAIVETRLLSE